MDDIKCVYLGVQVGQFIKNFEICKMWMVLAERSVDGKSAGSGPGPLHRVWTLRRSLSQGL